MRKILLSFVVMLWLIWGSMALAQPPAEDPTENICYTGGLWEGKCDWPTDAEDEWAWTCGYYYAAAFRGAIPREQLPSWCGTLTAEVGLCLNSFDGVYLLIYNLTPGVPDNVYYVTTPDYQPEPNACANYPSLYTPSMWIHLSEQPDEELSAEEICEMFDTTYPWNYLFEITMPGYADFNYICTVAAS